MRYPMMNNLLSFEKTKEGTYIVENVLTEEKRIMSENEVIFLRKLNGKRNPYRILKDVSRNEVSEILTGFKKEGLLFGGRIRKLSLLQVLFALFMPRFGKKHRRVAVILKNILVYSWIGMLLLGIWMFLHVMENPYGIVSNSYDIVVGNVLGLVSGIALHEVAHAIVALAYGGKVLEFGVMLYCLMPGAYVVLKQDKLNHMQRAKVCAAGIEMNLWLCGFFVLLANLFRGHFYIFIIAGYLNLALAVLNLLFIEGVDGFGIVSNLLGIEDFVQQAKRVTKSSKKRKKLKRYGLNGEVFIVACYLVRAFQMALPIVIGVSVLSLWGGI